MDRWTGALHGLGVPHDRYETKRRGKYYLHKGKAGYIFAGKLYTPGDLAVHILNIHIRFPFPFLDIMILFSPK